MGKEFLKHTAGMVASLTIIFSSLWFVGQPHAENLVQRVVDAKGYASKLQVDETNRVVRENKSLATENKEAQIRQQETLKSVKELLQEQRSDFKALLQELRQQRQ